MNLRRARSVHARALARLGWSYEPIPADAHKARECYAGAVELESGNPYYLADMLGFELHYVHEAGLLSSFRFTIRGALHACEEHEAAGTELPAAHFTAGRLLLLLDEPLPALHAYARGVRYCLANEGISSCDVLTNEIAWLHRINPGRQLSEQHQWAKDLLTLAQRSGDCSSVPASPTQPASAFPRPVLIVAGGAASLPETELPRIRELLVEALSDFPGTVFSGGTTSGVPGCLGDVAASLAKQGRKRFQLHGYIPKSLPYDAEKDKRYDRIVVSGAQRFSPAQILHGWNDILADGVQPANVLLLGFGGGPLAAFEYRLALALGATVGVLPGSADAADSLLKDPLWSTLPRLFPLPADPKTLRAFVLPDGSQFDSTVLETMAQEFHTRYRDSNLKKIKPDNLKLWEHLPETFKKANREQAAYAIRILEAAGFGFREVKGPVPVVPVPPLDDARSASQTTRSSRACICIGRKCGVLPSKVWRRRFGCAASLIAFRPLRLPLHAVKLPTEALWQNLVRPTNTSHARAMAILRRHGQKGTGKSTHACLLAAKAFDFGVSHGVAFNGTVPASRRECVGCCASFLRCMLRLLAARRRTLPLNSPLNIAKDCFGFRFKLPKVESRCGSCLIAARG